MCACTKLTTMDPSPTADATRFTDPLRTSPAANTPGRLVSSRNGARPTDRQRSAPVMAGGSAVPVVTKPRRSSSTHPRSQAVLASAPMNRKSELVASVRSSRPPVATWTACSRPSPSSPVTVALG